MPAQRHIYYLMENDSWRRFLKIALVSNTGDERRRMFTVQVAVGGLCYLILVVLFYTCLRNYPDRRIRWLVLPTACLTMSGLVQRAMDFCLLWGLLGRMWRRVYHSNDQTVVRVQDSCARALHRRQAFLLIGIIACASLAMTLPIVFVL